MPLLPASLPWNIRATVWCSTICTGFGRKTPISGHSGTSAHGHIFSCAPEAVASCQTLMKVGSGMSMMRMVQPQEEKKSLHQLQSPIDFAKAEEPARVKKSQLPLPWALLWGLWWMEGVSEIWPSVSCAAWLWDLHPTAWRGLTELDLWNEVAYTPLFEFLIFPLFPTKKNFRNTGPILTSSRKRAILKTNLCSNPEDKAYTW